MRPLSPTNPRVTRASLRAMRRRSADNLSIGTGRRPRNSLLTQLQQAAWDVERLCDEVERLKDEVVHLRGQLPRKRPEPEPPY